MSPIKTATLAQSQYALQLLLLLVAGCIVLSALLGIKLGTIPLSWGELLGRVAELPGSFFQTDMLDDLIFNLRLPRVLLAGIVGMGLSVVGVVMQSVLNNPLADPYVLGVSAGAMLGAVLSIFIGLGGVLGGSAIGLCAAVGAFCASLVVLLLASSGSGMTSTKLLLSGMSVHAVCSGFASLLMYTGTQKEGMQSIAYWLLGNVANAKLETALLLLGVTLLIVGYFFVESRNLNLLLFGGDSAATLGVDVGRKRLVFLLVQALLMGFMVASVGLVGFLGLIVPHIGRALFGADHRKLIPVAAFLGALFGIWADILSRTIVTGVEIPYGVMLALVGGPFFLYLLTYKPGLFKEES